MTKMLLLFSIASLTAHHGVAGVNDNVNAIQLHITEDSPSAINAKCGTCNGCYQLESNMCRDLARYPVANKRSCVQNGGLWCAMSIDANESSLGFFADGGGFDSASGNQTGGPPLDQLGGSNPVNPKAYNKKYTKTWCKDKALHDYGYADNEKNSSACRSVCDNDSKCKFYLFGHQTKANISRCVTFASCDVRATFEDGTPTVYEKLADTLPSGSVLKSGEELTSSDGNYRFVMQADDGNAVVYGTDGPTFSTGPKGKGAEIRFQDDSNMVVYREDGTYADWDSGTTGCQAKSLVIQNDGNLVMLTANRNPVWASSENNRELCKTFFKQRRFRKPMDHEV